MSNKKTQSALGLLGAIALAVPTAALADTAWNGSTSDSWSDAANWTDSAPDASDIAIFNSETYTNSPVLDISTVPAVLGLRFGDGLTDVGALTIGTTSSATAGQVTSGSHSTGSTDITLVDASQVVVGQRVSGSRIPTNTFVTAINGNVITLSQPINNNQSSGSQLTFYSSLNLGSSGVVVSAGVKEDQEIAATMVLASSQTWTNNSTASNVARITGGVYLGSFALTLEGVAGSGYAFTSSGALNGTGGLIINTEGTVTFGAGSGGRPSNPFSGGVTLNSGTLLLSGGNSGGSGGAGALGSGVLTINGGQINGGGNIAGHALTISGQVWNADWTYLSSKSLDMGSGEISLGTAPVSTRTVTVNANGGLMLTLGGAIVNGTTTSHFTKAGGGIMVLTGASTYTGGTEVAAGTLRVSGNGALGTGDVTVASGATLELQAATAINDDASLILADGAVANLNFDAGLFEVISSLTLDGVIYSEGVFNALTHPTFFSGAGNVAVPEPASLGLIGIGAFGLMARRSRRA